MFLLSCFSFLIRRLSSMPTPWQPLGKNAFFATNIIDYQVLFPYNNLSLRPGSCATCAKEVADELGVAFVDMHNLTADYLDHKAGSKEKATKYYKRDHTHLAPRCRAQRQDVYARVSRRPTAT